MGHGLRVRLACADPIGWLSRINEGMRAHEVLVTHAPEIGDGTRRCATLLLFDALTSDVMSTVAAASRGGRDRTIAVGTTRRGLGADGAWSLLRAGASDVFAWDEVTDPLAHVAARLERWARIDGALAAPEVQRDLVGGSPRWVACLRQAVETAVFSDGPVLLLGESGTGKELLARLVHALDSRRDKGDLVVLDCTTVVPELAGSEFFGHERGAFTGAVAARNGAFALADGGTLFLDEVGELPPALQAQLLRVVQERTYKRVGSNVWQRTNFRLVCATHRDLRQDVAAGRFRGDLYHRIASRIVRLPPLRERREDILPLAQRFLQALRPSAAGTAFDQAVARFLITRDYPGNVRELRQLVERIGDRHVGPGPVTPGDVPEEEWTCAPPLTAAMPAKAAHVANLRVVSEADGAAEADECGANGAVNGHGRNRITDVDGAVNGFGRADDAAVVDFDADVDGDGDRLSHSPAGTRRGDASFDEAVVEALDRGFGLREIGRAATEAAIRVAIATEAGNLQRAAKRLGVTDRALQLRRAQRLDP